MVIFLLAPDQTIAQMWSSGARGGTDNRWTQHCKNSATVSSVG